MEKAIQNKIDNVWITFFSGGIANPLTVIEQITYLLFIKGLDDIELTNEQTEQILGTKFKRIFNESNQHCRWSKFKNRSATEMFKIVSEEVFPFIKNLQPIKESSFSRYMENAIFIIPTPLILEKVVTQLDSIPMKNRDTKGDIYEYMLSKLSTSGDLGQFRTPRHIIDLIIELIHPSPEDVICDPACGSGGFLVESGEYIIKNYQDLLEDDTLRHHYNNLMFYGFDTDPTMLRLSAMNMIMHGIENPNIKYQDSVSEDNLEEEKYSIIFANPPFKGTIDTERTARNLLKVCKTKKTELLFLVLFLRLLIVGGRCGCIVPDGVLFGSSNAHQSIRKELVENHKLEAIISMPSGIFQPYAGVSTAIMIFTKTKVGGTNKVWFYDMKSDGYSLDAKRTRINETDIPDIIERFHHLDKEVDRLRTDQSFLVDKSEIVENGYDLSINRYKEIVSEKKEYKDPKVMLKKVLNMEEEIQKHLIELEELL